MIIYKWDYKLKFIELILNIVCIATKSIAHDSWEKWNEKWNMPRKYACINHVKLDLESTFLSPNLVFWKNGFLVLAHLSIFFTFAAKLDLELKSFTFVPRDEVYYYHNFVDVLKISEPLQKECHQCEDLGCLRN